MDFKEIESKVSELCWVFTTPERKSQLFSELNEARVRVKQGATGVSWSIVPAGEQQSLLAEAPAFGELSAGVKSLLGSQRNRGHGHAWERPDRVKSRCGGPAMCHVCSHDIAWLGTLSDLERQYFLM